MEQEVAFVQLFEVIGNYNLKNYIIDGSLR